MIHHALTPDWPLQPLLMCDLAELASCNDVLGIYAGAGGRIDEELGTGIAHAASWICMQLNVRKLLKPDSSVVLPLVFKGTFLPLMKALLLSRVIAKAPLSSANDIRGLRRAKDALETKGYRGEGLAKLLIAPHRLWMPKRMARFV